MKKNWLLIDGSLINLNSVETVHLRGRVIVFTFVGGEDDTMNICLDSDEEASQKFDVLVSVLSNNMIIVK